MLKKILITTSLLLMSSWVMAGGGGPSSSPEETQRITDAVNSWQGRATRFQSQIDLHSPMSKNNILGTHNSYNSREYADDGYVRNNDPQQHHTLVEQLRLGARFLELDVHWAHNTSGLKHRLVLCHGGFCAPAERQFQEGLAEIRGWLDSTESAQQVIIVYLEDHAGNDRHQRMYDQLYSALGSYIYKSNGCRAIPNDLTKADVLAAGAKVVVWKDGRDGAANCSANNDLKNTVFTSLGSIDRIWEDRTVIGDLFGGVDDEDLIYADDVKRFFEQGRNLVNLDDLHYQDDRIKAHIWSWNTNEPNNANNNEDCVVQRGDNGRWADVGCNDNRIYPYACHQSGTENWTVSNATGKYSGGQSACNALGANWQFKTPTNAKYNKALRDAANAAGHGHVWLSLTDQTKEGEWTEPGVNFPADVNYRYRELKDGRSGKCMDIKGGNNPSNGTNVQLYDCHGGDNQKWRYEPATGFMRSRTGKCLDNRGQAYNNGEIVVWDCVNSNNLRFDWVGNSLRNRHNNGIAVDAFGTGNGANISQWSYHGGSNQQWYWGN